MRIIYDTVTNDAGTVIRNASVELLTQEGDPVEIFADKDGNTSLGTSITTDDNGFFQFFAPDGSEYSLRFSYGQISRRPEEQTSELQSLMRISNAVFCLKKKIK